METYGHDFFKDRHANTVYAAESILNIVKPLLPTINSAVDLGCGVGTWLSVLKSQGVADVCGVDGSWVERDLLEVDESEFKQLDLDKTIDLGRSYDLAVSLEVAEHLMPASADNFVESLTGFSDFVLFSAAIPFQAKKFHVNEQWPDYWAEKFAAKGYVCFDLVRDVVWDDARIPVWYRQNTFLYVKRERLGDLNQQALAGQEPVESPKALVHPDYYLAKAQAGKTVKSSWKLLRRALKASLKN